MPRRDLTRNGPRTYAELRRQVEAALLIGQRKIEEAKVHTYWETGRLIHQHLLLHQERAEYGAEVIPRLGRDLGISDTVIYRCLRFFRAFPILAARPELSWAHYRALICVEDPAQRKAIAAEAVRSGWTSRQLEERIRPLALRKQDIDGETPGDGADPRAESPRLVAKRGTIGVHRLVPGGKSLAVDLGFTSCLDLTPEEAGSLKAGTLIRLDSNGEVSTAEAAQTADSWRWIPARRCF